MKNFVQPGDTIQLTAPYTVVSGACAKVGSIVGVAAQDCASGAVGVFTVEGVFDLAKVAATAITQGAKVYWDDSAKNVTTTVGSNTAIGVATKAAASADTTVRVRLNGSF